jgi:hypothetical protein
LLLLTTLFNDHERTKEEEKWTLSQDSSLWNLKAL